MNGYITGKKLFVNVSKGIEPNTSLRVSQIVNEEIDKGVLAALFEVSNVPKPTS